MENTLSPIRRFWLLLKPDKLEIRNLYLYAIIIGLLNLVLPLGIQSIINLIQGGAVSTSWLMLILLVALAITLSGIMQINQLRITENLQQKIFTRAAFEFTYRIPRIRLEQLYRKYAPELMNRFFDVVSIQKGITKILIDFSAASFSVLFGLILLSLYHPFFIVFSLLLVIIIIAIFWMTMRRGLNTSLEESKHKYNLAHWLEEMARSNTTFKLAGNSNLSMDKTNEHSEKYIEAREKHFSVLRLQYILMVVFKVLVAVGLLLIGGLLVIEQQMNIGQFVAAEIVILLIVNSVEKVIINFETIYDVLTSLEKLGQVVDLELEHDGGMDFQESLNGLEVKINHLSYKYPSENKYALQDINLTISPHERINIQGKNDSGKSTLLYMLAGLVAPTSGAILIDSVPAKNYEYNQLRSQIGAYLRDENLFEGTLLENITLGREKATFDNVKWAIKSLHLENLLENLPDGYNTKILPMGRQFSKSTMAKILIARAIVNKPKVLLFENSFSVFSTEDKAAILEFILHPDHPWTVLISSSQPLNHNMITRTVQLESGKIINQ